MKFTIEVSDEKLAKELECKEHYIIEGILEILKNYDVTQIMNEDNRYAEDFRCIEEIVCLLEDNGYNPSPCHDF